MTKRVVRDSSTGRFRSVDAEEEQVVEEQVVEKEAHKESDAERIRGASNKLNLAVHELEEALHEVGLIDEPQYSHYYYHDEEKEDSKGNEPREPSDFDQLFTSLRDLRSRAESNERPYNMTRLNALSALSALSFVVHRALFRIDPDFNIDPYLGEAATDTTGVIGFGDTESHFNRFAALGYEQQNRLSYLLLGNSTYNKEAQDNPEVCDYLSVVSENYREHLHGAANVMETILGHTEWLVETIRTELL